MTSMITVALTVEALVKAKSGIPGYKYQLMQACGKTVGRGIYLQNPIAQVCISLPFDHDLNSPRLQLVQSCGGTSAVAIPLTIILTITIGKI